MIPPHNMHWNFHQKEALKFKYFPKNIHLCDNRLAALGRLRRAVYIFVQKCLNTFIHKESCQKLLFMLFIKLIQYNQ